jgi:DNA-binding transcriptional regulator GbsR (MarR family)
MSGGEHVSVPEEIYFLCMLHNIGATSSERALTFEEIVRWTMLEPSKVEQNLKILMDGNYVAMSVDSGTKKYFITIDGIRKVLSMYS